jgi:hypothetical protein
MSSQNKKGAQKITFLGFLAFVPAASFVKYSLYASGFIP